MRFTIINSGDTGAGTNMTDDELFWQDILRLHIFYNGANGETMEAPAFNAVLVGNFGIEGVVFHEVGAGIMKARIGDGDDRGAVKSLDKMFDFAGDYRNVERSGFFANLKLLKAFVIDDVILGEIFAWGSGAGEDGIQLGYATEIALVGEDLIEMGDGTGERFESLLKLLLSTVGAFESTDDFFPLKLEMERTKQFRPLVKGVFTGATAWVGDKN